MFQTLIVTYPLRGPY